MSALGRRYKDVLFALYTAGTYSEALNKVQLQKLIYLGDTLSILWELYRPSEGYETYRHGPYDAAIQNAVDVLAFRGAVDISQSNFNNKNHVAVSYKISSVGKQIVVRMVQGQLVFSREVELYQLLGVHVNNRGWENIRQLVYSEANYVLLKAQGYGVPIVTNNISDNVTLQMILGFNDLVRDSKKSLSRENLVSLFFQVLDAYQELTT